MVQVNATRFATEKGTFFVFDKAGFEEIHKTALAFECSVVHEFEKSKTLRERRQAVLVAKMKNNKNLLLTQLSMWGNVGPRVIATISWWQVCFQNNISYNAANDNKDGRKKLSCLFCP